MEQKSKSNPPLGAEQFSLSEELNRQQAINQSADLADKITKRDAAIHQYFEAGHDPKYLGNPLKLERLVQSLSSGEKAFIAIATIFGVVYGFAMITLPLAWPVTLLLLILIWIPLSIGLTLALKTGAQVAFRVEHDNPDGIRRATKAFIMVFVVFLLALAVNAASRLTAMDPTVFGTTAVMVEVSSLLCAAVLGALAHAYGYMVALVNLILDLQHRINILQATIEGSPFLPASFRGEKPDSDQSEKLLN